MQHLYAYGQTDKHSDTSKKNPQPLLGITRAQIEHLITNPQHLEKGLGAWVIPSTLPTRNFKDQRTHGRYGFGWLDIDENSASMSHVVDVIRAIMPGHKFYIYTTAGARPEAGKLKFRVLWFYTALIETGAEWARYQELINNHIETAGIKPDRVNERSAQLCYLPNAPTDFYLSQTIEGQDVDPKVWADAGILPARKIAPPLNRKALAEENPNFDKLIDLVEVLDQDHPEGLLVSCPWAEEHSGGSDSALLVPPGSTNANKGGFRCLHHSHEHKNIGHVYAKYKLNPKVDTADAAAQAFGDRATLPPGAKPPVAKPGPPPGTGPADVLAMCATASVENLGEVARLISSLEVEDREACILRFQETTGAGLQVIRKAINTVDKKELAEKHAQVRASREFTGHPLAKMNLTRPDGTINPDGFARIDGTEQIIASAIIDPLGNPRIGTRTFKMFGDWGKAQPKYHDDAADGKPQLVSDAWLECGAGVHDVFDALTFAPGKPRIVETTTGTHKRQLNTWNEPTLSPVRNDTLIQGFLSHIYTWFCSENMEQYNYFIKWIADIFQNPGKKPGVAILLSGGIGIGKSEVVNAIGKLLGSSYTTVDGPGALNPENGFNEHLASRLLVRADEFSERGVKSSAKFRAMVTSDRFSSNGKSKALVELPCFLRIIACTNEEVPIDTKNGERRLCWLDCSEDMDGAPNTPERFAAMDGLFMDLNRAGFGSALYAYFLAVSLEGFNIKMPPNTKSKQAAIDAGKDSVGHFIDACLEMGFWPGSDIKIMWGQDVPKKLLQTAYIFFCRDMRIRPLHVSPLGRKLLENHGITGARVREGRTLDYVYNLPIK